MTRYILSIDQGTTSTRAFLFTLDGQIATICRRPLDLITPKPGWVEQDADQIIDDTLNVIQNVMDQGGIAPDQVIGIGITNQRETTIAWDKTTGKPIYNAIVWQDRRTTDFCQTLTNDGHGPMIRDKTGLRPDPYFSATKIRWILNHVDVARDLANAGDLAVGTVDSWLHHKLTGGAAGHLTDITNASRTMLFNIHDLTWDNELSALFDIPLSCLPDVCPNTHDYGMTDPDITGFKLPIRSMIGDQQSALIGQSCITPGMVKSTYGTGCFALIHTGDTPVFSEHDLLTTIAAQIGGHTTYAIEGAIFNAGSAVQFLRDNLGLIDHAADSEVAATQVDDNGGVYFIPALTGLGAPHWQPSATGMITGLTRGVNKNHIIRATLEAQAYQTYDLLDAMMTDSAQEIDVLRLDGGMVENDFVCQFLADILNIPVDRPNNLETTALGAARLAAIQASELTLDDLEVDDPLEHRFEPNMEAAIRDQYLSGWGSAMEQVKTGKGT
jgi:glycerol kinase